MLKFSQMKKSNTSKGPAEKKINEEPEKQDLRLTAIQFYSGG